MGNSSYCCPEANDPEDQLLNYNIRLPNEIDTQGAQISLSIHDECYTCHNYFIQLQLVDLKFQAPPYSSHFEESPVQLSFSELLTFPCDDKIINYTTSYYQLAFSQQRRDPKRIQLLRKFQRYFPETFECKEKEILFCLKEQIWEFFACYNFDRHRFSYYRKFTKNQSIVSRAAQIFCEVSHICQCIKHIILSNFRKNQYQEQIRIYVLLYNKYQKIIYNIYEQNQYLDLIPDLYNQVFHIDPNKGIEKTFIGYCMRCWCQIVLTEDIRDALRTSYRNVDLLKDPFLIYQYINSVIDISSNESQINWLGHSKKISLNNKLIDLNINLIKQLAISIDQMTTQEFESQIDETLKLLRYTCPQWFYEIYYENLGRELLIKKFINEISTKKKIPLKAAYQDTEIDLSTAISTTFDQVLKQSFQLVNESTSREASQKSQIVALYLQTALSLESTADFFVQRDNSQPLSNSLTISQNALKISEEVDCSQLYKFHSLRKTVRMNIEIRDYILEQRTKTSNEEDFDFFRSFQFNNKYTTKEEEECAKDVSNEIFILRDLIKDCRASEILYQK